VVAEKQFTIHDAPAVLTVHLKRFSPLGRKIGHFVHYDDRLSLQPVMSEGQYGPSYRLYGIISHAGGGPNSGHYFAHVKAANGRWYEMNDEMVSLQHRPPVDMKSAYILFYMKDKGQSLDAAVRSTETIGSAIPSAKSSIVGSMKKRKVVDDDEDVGVKVDRPFIGPLLPSPIPNSDACPSLSSKTPDPQAVSLQKKIAAATKSSDALSSLALYGDDDSTDSPTEPRPTDSDTPTDSPTATQPPTSSLPSEATSDASTASTATNTPPFNGITPSSFYATPTSTPVYNSHNSQLNDKKRKPPDSDTDDDDGDEGRPSSGTKRYSESPPSTFTSKQAHHHNHSHSPHHTFRRKSFGGGAVNPYNRVVGNNTLFHKKKYTMKKRMIM